MAIAKERIEAIKRDVELAALIKAKGIELKKNGTATLDFAPSMMTPTLPYR